MVWAKLTIRTCTTHRRPSPARGPSGWDGRLIRQPGQLDCCQLSLKKYPFYRPGASARYSSLTAPVETGTPPECLPPETAGNGSGKSGDKAFYHVLQKCQAKLDIDGIEGQSGYTFASFTITAAGRSLDSTRYSLYRARGVYIALPRRAAFSAPAAT